MISPLDTYLGWEQPEHFTGCRRPAWDVGMRTEREEFRRGGGNPERRHSCPDENCGHGPRYDKVVVRLVCHSCGSAHVISGEQTGIDTRTAATSTNAIGYGLPPRQAAGLLLWAGHPWLGGDGWGDELRGGEPHDFVVTRPKVKQVTADVVVGQITQSRGGRGGVVWTALAVPDPQGQFGFGQHLRWAHANDGRGRGGSPLRSVAAAARWIGARLAEQKPAAELAAGGVR